MNQAGTGDGGNTTCANTFEAKLSIIPTAPTKANAAMTGITRTVVLARFFIVLNE